MDFSKVVDFTLKPGRSLSPEEREALEHLYPWPRPDRKLCRREDTNEKWRLGRT